MEKVRVGIIGGAGYTGGEALRLLIHHPGVELMYVHSNSNGGNPVSDVHTDLFGDTALQFVDTPVGSLPRVDVMFLCVGHGDARKFLEANPVPDDVRIIDLSQDFRIAPDNSIGGHEFIYGLPEQNREAIRQARNIANPGCFATCLQLALLPLAARQLIRGDVHISATTGSTGAGQKPTATSHFSWRANNLSTYKVFEHQHLREVTQMIRTFEPQYEKAVNFIPYRGDFTRGIIASVYTDFAGTIEEARRIYEDYYASAAFTHVSDRPVSLKQVVNTNKCLVHLTVHEGKLLILSVIDNLLKGASGQAVQNMNLMCGLPETMGLQLKPSAF